MALGQQVALESRHGVGGGLAVALVGLALEEAELGQLLLQPSHVLAPAALGQGIRQGDGGGGVQRLEGVLARLAAGSQAVQALELLQCRDGFGADHPVRRAL